MAAFLQAHGVDTHRPERNSVCFISSYHRCTRGTFPTIRKSHFPAFNGTLDNTSVSVDSELSDPPSVFRETLALNKRMWIQLKRRPAGLVSGLLQPLLWLIFFGALFRHAPPAMTSSSAETSAAASSSAYFGFLAAGQVAYTAFNSAMNAGLPLMFDREFGFLNRLLVAPLASGRASLLLSSLLYVIAVAAVQSILIMGVALLLGSGIPSLLGVGLVLLVCGLLVVGYTTLSLAMAFVLPGHVEFLAVVLVTTLPVLFTSTALAPLTFMPGWLKVLASLNPLTYASELIRYTFRGAPLSLSSVILESPILGDVSVLGGLVALAVADMLIIGLLRKTFRRALA
eukprot:Rmarinus@m.10072